MENGRGRKGGRRDGRVGERSDPQVIVSYR